MASAMCMRALPARSVAGSRKSAASKRSPVVCAAAPFAHPTVLPTAPSDLKQRMSTPELITREGVQGLEALLDAGAGVSALRRFNDALRAVPEERWEAVLKPVFNELCYNLESFNPAFTATLLKVQSTIGVSHYGRRDASLKHLIQPLAGEYGMHNGEEQARTHRELFTSFYESLFHEPMDNLFEDSPAPVAAEKLFNEMMRDIMSGGGAESDLMEQAYYALGYNLAIEYLADYEKTWMLDSFRSLSDGYLAAQGRNIDWLFLEVHAEGEAEHAAIGHNAVISIVPAEAEDTLRRAMLDHDRDFAVFYNHLADLLEA